MKHPGMISPHTEPRTKATSLFTERLEQLGYKCVDNSCDQYTSLRFTPLEEKRKERPEPSLKGTTKEEQ